MNMSPVPRNNEPESGTEAALVPVGLESKLEQVLEPIVGKPNLKLVVRKVEAVASEFFEGPLPHPRHLEQYELIQPGLADRIVSMAEKEQAFRHSSAGKGLSASISSHYVGLGIGLVVSAGLIWGAVECARMNQPGVAIALVGASALGLVSSFLNATKISRENGRVKELPATKVPGRPQLPPASTKQKSRRRR